MTNAAKQLGLSIGNALDVPSSSSWRLTYILTSQDFSWLQNGQVNWVSRLPVSFFLGGGFLLDFLRPIVESCGSTEGK